MKKILGIALIVLLIVYGHAFGWEPAGAWDSIPNASATKAGKVELATDAETVTGTATDKATTPANITAKIDTDGTLTGNADTRIPSQKATKTYADTKIPTSQKAAASGVASLDGSSLVVQNPANATATPTASKIPIADGSGDLDAGWVPDVITHDLDIGSTSAGKNLTINATLGSELITWTDAGWNEDGVTWTFVGGVLTHVTGNTTTVTAAGVTCVVGTTYKVVITGTGGGGTATYTLGGATGTTIADSGAIAIEDYITAVTTASLIITPASACTVAITNISVKALTDATGDVTVQGDLFVGSKIKSPGGTGGITITPNGFVGIGITTATPGFWLDITNSGTFRGGTCYGNSFMSNDFRASANNSTPVFGDRNFTVSDNGMEMVPGTFSGADVTQNAAVIKPTWNQTATSSGTDLLISRTETSLGSGAQKFISCKAGVAGTTENFYVLNTGDVYTVGDVSALTFTDRTPFYDGDALAAIKNIKGKDGKIDHASLPEFAQKTISRTVVNSVTEKEVQVTKEEALESVEVDVQVMQDKVTKAVDKDGKETFTTTREPVIDRTETEYKLDNGVVTPVVKPIYKTTKETRKKLKDGIRFDEKTGKFYKKVTTIDKTEIEEPGRDLGAMISILVKANQQLLERVEQLEKQ